MEEEKTITKKFIGIVLTIIAAGAFVTYLVIININGGSVSASKSSNRQTVEETTTTTAQENLDGEYYRYYIASNTGELSMSTDEPDVIIDGNSINLDSNDFTIDKDKKIIQTRFDIYHYTFEDGVLSFADKTYAKKGSKKYKEVLKEISHTQEITLEDGVYKEIYKSSDGYHISNILPIEVDGTAVSWGDRMYSIDYDDHLFKGNGTTVAFKAENHRVTVNNDVYVRVGSKLYNTFLEKGAIEEE